MSLPVSERPAARLDAESRPAGERRPVVAGLVPRVCQLAGPLERVDSESVPIQQSESGRLGKDSLAVVESRLALWQVEPRWGRLAAHYISDTVRAFRQPRRPPGLVTCSTDS